MTKKESDILERLLESHSQTHEWQKGVDARLICIEDGNNKIKRVLFGEQKEDIQISKGLLERHQDLLARQKEDEERWAALDKIIDVVKIVTSWKTIFTGLGILIATLLAILEKIGVTNFVQ